MEITDNLDSATQLNYPSKKQGDIKTSPDTQR